MTIVLILCKMALKMHFDCLQISSALARYTTRHIAPLLFLTFLHSHFSHPFIAQLLDTSLLLLFSTLFSHTATSLSLPHPLTLPQSPIFLLLFPIFFSPVSYKPSALLIRSSLFDSLSLPLSLLLSLPPSFSPSLPPSFSTSLPTSLLPSQNTSFLLNLPPSIFILFPPLILIRCDMTVIEALEKLKIILSSMEIELDDEEENKIGKEVEVKAEVANKKMIACPYSIVEIMKTV